MWLVLSRARPTSAAPVRPVAATPSFATVGVVNRREWTRPVILRVGGMDGWRSSTWSLSRLLMPTTRHTGGGYGGVVLRTSRPWSTAPASARAAPASARAVPAPGEQHDEPHEDHEQGGGERARQQPIDLFRAARTGL